VASINLPVNIKKLLANQQVEINANTDAKALSIKANTDAKTVETKSHITTKNTETKNLVSSENDATQNTLSGLGTAASLDANVLAINNHIDEELTQQLATLPSASALDFGSQREHFSYGGDKSNVWNFYGDRFNTGSGSYVNSTAANTDVQIANVNGAGWFCGVIGRLPNNSSGSTEVIKIIIDGVVHEYSFDKTSTTQRHNSIPCVNNTLLNNSEIIQKGLAIKFNISLVVTSNMSGSVSGGNVGTYGGCAYEMGDY